MIAFSTFSEKRFLSTARALPAGRRAVSAAFIISESHRRISSCRTPTAFAVLSSDRKEFEHTNSARFDVTCASVII